MTDTGLDLPGELAPHPSGARGTLRTGAGWEFPVQTYDSGKEVVLIVLAGAAPTTVEDVDPATLEYTSARGVIRLHGEARFEDPSVVRFRAEGEPEVIQRREFVRVHTPQEVRLSDEPMRLAHTIDLSGGGMLVTGAPMLRQDQLVAFEIHVGSEESPIHGTARVVRAHADGRRALTFERIDEAERQRLIRFVFACLRSSRAKTRGDLI